MIFFQYDFAGNLINKTVSISSGVQSESYVLDDLTNVVHQANDLGDQFSVLTGRTIDDHLATIRDTRLSEFRLTDNINSTVATVDGAGAKVADFVYEPYGETTSIETTFPFQFTGRVPVTESLYYYRARYYDPQTGRFISEDPIGFSGGDLHLNRYVRDNPIKFIDPRGTTTLGSIVDDHLPGPGIGQERLQYGFATGDRYLVYLYFAGELTADLNKKRKSFSGRFLGALGVGFSEEERLRISEEAWRRSGLVGSPLPNRPVGLIP